MVSLSHVSVINPELGLKSKMVERTSSILGARDIVFVSIKLRPNTLRDSIGRSVMTGNVFLVFTHVTSIMTTVAIRHVGAHPNVNKCPSM